MSGYHWTNLPQISSCHYISWMSRDETNGIQLCVYVCVCWVHCPPTYPPPQTHTLHWLNPYLAPLSRGWDAGNPRCQAPMLGGSLNLSLPPPAWGLCARAKTTWSLNYWSLSANTWATEKKTSELSVNRGEYSENFEARLKEKCFYLWWLTRIERGWWIDCRCVSIQGLHPSEAMPKKAEREKTATSRGVDRHFCGSERQKSWRKGKTSGDATRKCSKG